jgi:integrase
MEGSCRVPKSAYERARCFPVGSVRPSDLEAWVADLMAAGKAPVTVQKAWQIASGVFRLAVRDRLIALSPARDVRLPKIERSEPIPLTVEQVLQLADAIDPRYRALVLVGAFGGLRIGELAGLELGDFDPLRNLVRVRRTASDVRGRVIVGPPKTSKSIRTVVLPRSITEQLVEHVARLEEKGPEAWLFPAPEGGPIHRTAWMPPRIEAGTRGCRPRSRSRNPHVAAFASGPPHRPG